MNDKLGISRHTKYSLEALKGMKGEIISFKSIPRGAVCKTTINLRDPNFGELCRKDTIVTIADEAGCFVYRGIWYCCKEYMII